MLRAYQTELIDRLRGALGRHHRVLAVMPTGAGKTHTFCTVVQLAAARGKRVLIMVHRAELIAQTVARLRAMGIVHGVMAPNYRSTEAAVQVASIQSMLRREWAADLVIVDEAHHCGARSWQQVLGAYSEAHIIGWTATPQRLDGKGLNAVFDDMVIGPTIHELIGNGYLSQYRLFAPPTGVNLADLKRRAGDYQIEQIEQRMSANRVLYAAVQNYLKYAEGRQAIAFCTTIKHAELVREAFCSADIVAATIDGTLKPNDRADLISRFRSGVIQVLISVELISEGFDVPACDCAILLRPTASLSVYLQQVGRALRPSVRDAVILDCAGNSQTHGLPCEDREWSLHGVAPKSRSDLRNVAIRVCPSCYAVHRPAPYCPYCGHVHTVTREVPTEVQRDLAEVDVRKAAAEERLAIKLKRSEIGKARTIEELLRIAQDRGYKPGWAYAVMKGRG